MSVIRTRRAIIRGAASGLLSAISARHLRAESRYEKLLKWIVFYGVDAPESLLAKYDIVILDYRYKGAVKNIISAGSKVCGYISLGEINSSDPVFTDLDRNALLERNPNWTGTYRVDVRHPAWQALVLEKQIPGIISSGFNGLMFDTLDTPPFLERSDVNRYRGMSAAAIKLVAKIRSRWPDLMLISNRGYAILPDIVLDVDAIIAESLLSAPDNDSDGFSWVDQKQVELQLSLLEPAKVRRDPLPILSLDYWDPNDLKTVAEIYRKERALGHHPYVAPRLLNQIIAEPN